MSYLRYRQLADKAASTAKSFSASSLRFPSIVGSVPNVLVLEPTIFSKPACYGCRDSSRSLTRVYCPLQYNSNLFRVKVIQILIPRTPEEIRKKLNCELGIFR